jgi:hypothetical protein
MPHLQPRAPETEGQKAFRPRSLTSRAEPRQLCRMTDLPAEEQAFLRDLVKASRQKHHHVKWTDRDGSERVTVLAQTEIVRLNTIAHRMGISKVELMRQAAHIPVAKTPA